MKSLSVGSAFLEHGHDLTGFRKPADRFLRKDRLAVHDDFEHASAAWRQRRFSAQFLQQLGRQTGSPWLVVSEDAVADLDLHGSPPVSWPGRGHSLPGSGGCQGEVRCFK